MPNPFLNLTQAAERRFYFVGGGVAAMAAAVFLIRDGDVAGSNITIIEELGVPGGSLDAAGSPETGYVLRGGRMLEHKYLCTFSLFDSIPALDGRQSVTAETLAWNETLKTDSKSRLMRGGRRVTSPLFGLSEGHILALEWLAVEPEMLIGDARVSDRFDEDFFTTDFWFMWCTTFAFQPWHSAVEFKRYLLRFAHMVDGFDRLKGVMRTVYNQYDSLVRPLQAWLAERDVKVIYNTRVTDIRLTDDPTEIRATQIMLERDNLDAPEGVEATDLALADHDLVFVTLGSMTEGSALGGMNAAPPLRGKADGGAWRLWETLAAKRPVFGRPEVFTDHIDESKWISFTVTLNDPTLLRRLADLTGNAPGEGGLITFPDSPWLASIVVPHQPHFLGQPKEVEVCWGYGLRVDKPGEFVRKPMSACTGAEVLAEILGHLRIDAAAAAQIMATSCCIPCMMPFITAQFLRRSKGDRPEVVPEGSQNIAFMGQFCEMPDDVVFTIEYSIRSAQTAIHSLAGIGHAPPPVYKGVYDPRVLYKAFLALHDIRA